MAQARRVGGSSEKMNRFLLLPQVGGIRGYKKYKLVLLLSVVAEEEKYNEKGSEPGVCSACWAEYLISRV